MNVVLPALLGGLFAVTAYAEIVTLAHPDEPLPESDTVVWSPLFQAAWDQLNLECGGLPVRVEPESPLMAKLDSFQWKAGTVMPDGSWKAWCGPATPEFLKQVNEEAAAITGESKGPFALKNESPGNLGFFGILDREVEFHRAFSRASKVPMNFVSNGLKEPVRFFGVKGRSSRDYRDSVKVLAWRPVDHSFAIRIGCADSDDQVILYRPAKPLTFSAACRWLRTWRSEADEGGGEYGSWNDHGLHRHDEIRIPCVSLECATDFQEQLTSLRYHADNKVPWRIMRAEQVTRFQLHEKGARVTVSASGEAAPFADPLPVTPRRFVFDQPFFVFLWREKADWPYFGAWIGDAAALEAFE